jgi:signal transduction histidine kinase
MLAFGLFGLLAVAGAVAAMLVGHFLEAEATAQVERQQRLRAVEIAERLQLVCATSPADACDAALRTAAAPEGDELEELTLLTPDFGVFAGAPLPCAQRDPLVAAAFQARYVQTEARSAGAATCAADERSERFVVAVPMTLPGDFRLVLRYGFDRSPLQVAVAARQRTVLGALMLDFLAVLLFGIYLVGRSVVRPLVALTRLTGEVAAKGLAEAPDPRAAVSAGPSELLRLGQAYGDMLDRLRDQDALLRERLAELSAARDDLVRSEKLATVGRLAAGIAHEVGNPLTAVLGFVEYLRDERGAPVEPALRADLLARMNRELQRIHGTIRQLLDFSRPQPSQPRAVPVREVVDAALALVGYQQKIKTLTLETRLDAAPDVFVDPERLRQVLVNLLLNAADALAGKGTVRISAAAEAGRVVLRVSDDGPGIDADQAVRIFEPFVTTKAVGEGTGLGLAICQRLIEEAGGTIAVGTNENGRGACFEVRLPAAV